MEPKAHSTAASIQTSGFDYERYATYYTLNNLSHWHPDLWMNLVDLAYNDLHSNYTFVDVLEGASWNEVEGRPRRMLCTDMAKGRKKIQFTS
jgi:hypothetical protein